MSNVPEGAPLSDDGQYYWDGSEWQAVEGGATDGAAAAGEGEARNVEVAYETDLGDEVPVPEGEAVA